MFDAMLMGLTSINQVFEAGIAITAASLFLRALTFNLRDRVSRSFAIVLACVMILFSGEALASAVTGLTGLEFWLRFQWVGIVLIPAAYLHFSDALLETTGRPSRGRRRSAVQLAYGLSAWFLISLMTSKLVGPITIEKESLPHLERTQLSVIFSIYYVLAIFIAATVLWRAFTRTVLSASRNRMRLLFGSAVALAIGSYPYLMLGSGFAVANPAIFLFFAALGNILVFSSLLSMAYAVAFFGVAWPDRVVKSRLLKWLLRGPATVFIVLLLITGLRQIGQALALPISVAVIVITVTTVLLLEHVITLAAPVWERWLFYGQDHESVRLLQTLEERLLTSGDLRQFLEAVLAAVCDQFQVSTAFIGALDEQGFDMVVQGDEESAFSEQDLSANLLEVVSGIDSQETIFSWGEYWLLPLFNPQQEELLGILGVIRRENIPLDEALQESLVVLGQRAVLALEDRRLQKQVFQALETLSSKVDVIQRLRAASRYDQREILSDLDALPGSVDLAGLVKDALSHYWGGPKLTQSPLMRLQIVQQALTEHDGNPVNALRAILHKAVEQIRPEGERHFTGEWILYNILELKFMQGRKVREVAMRLAMSEADLYRKQRVAVENLAEAIMEMEREARQEK